MSKTVFTKGPWHSFEKKVDNFLGKCSIFGIEDDDTHTVLFYDTSGNINTRRANANLIAQAPAMYEILETILENQCRRCRNDADNPMDGGRVACGNGKRKCPFNMDDIKDVLAKARGEQ